jgi:transposase-like protein
MSKDNSQQSPVCPHCNSTSKQWRSSPNSSGTQRFLCGVCKRKYTPKPKPRVYSKEMRELVLREYYAGVSGRGIAKIHHMDKSNVYRWIADVKKTDGGVGKRENGFSEF